MKDRPSWAVLKTDVRNAFNSISSRLAADFPSLLHHFQSMYGLVFASDSGVKLLSSEEGVNLGDPLGPALFALGMHDSICRLQADHPEVVVLAYLDDVFILGEESSALNLFESVKSSLSDIYLVVADKKCEIFSPWGPVTPSSLPRCSDGSVVLGSPVGSDAFIESFCLQTSTKGQACATKPAVSMTLNAVCCYSATVTRHASIISAGLCPIVPLGESC